MTVVGYPHKAKASRVLGAFCGGAGGSVCEPLPRNLRPGSAAFYGVVDSTAGLWRQARREGRDWFYLDNSTFDAWREVQFRVAKNAVQSVGSESDCKRFDRLRIPIRPWRASGAHVLICVQSDGFIRTVGEYPGDWLKDTITELRRHTDRPIRIRGWNRDKGAAARSLAAELAGAWVLVTYSSAAAATAILDGVPAISTATWASAHRMGGSLSTIESPRMPDDRREWAGSLADRQFTLDEMSSGLAWRMVNAG